MRTEILSRILKLTSLDKFGNHQKRLDMISIRQYKTSLDHFRKKQKGSILFIEKSTSLDGLKRKDKTGILKLWPFCTILKNISGCLKVN